MEPAYGSVAGAAGHGPRSYSFLQLLGQRELRDVVRDAVKHISEWRGARNDVELDDRDPAAVDRKIEQLGLVLDTLGPVQSDEVAGERERSEDDRPRLSRVRGTTGVGERALPHDLNQAGVRDRLVVLIVHDARADPDGVVTAKRTVDGEGAARAAERREAILRMTVAGVGARSSEKEILAEEVEPRATLHPVDAKPSSGQRVRLLYVRPSFAVRFGSARRFGLAWRPGFAGRFSFPA